MIVLGIETSCDETAAALVEDGRRVLGEVVASQTDLHAEYAGVVPELASRAHTERLLPVVREALARAGVGLGRVDAVAVGHRPGLIGSLVVGVAGAKALAWSLGRPLVGIDHVHAHLYAPVLDGADDGLFPAIGLVVSGGHTSLYRLSSWLDVQRLGGTIDDAIGEAYDKAATILGVPFPGGPNLDRLAQSAGPDADAIDLPASRLGKQSLDFSFSGLKTALRYAAHGVPGERGPKAPPLDDTRRRALAGAFQRAACHAVIYKLERALAQEPGVRTILAGGGVVSNSRLRSELAALASRRGVAVRVPPPPWCVDNAAMIAGLAFHLLAAGRLSGTDLGAVPTSAL